mmetsp:Transcript_5646/g.16604  ORF Transcript_5646/g.16604 Transcript_5646/m.16604 type:complete len:971 (-) Transcript_5646:1185-4097(-)
MLWIGRGRDDGGGGGRRLLHGGGRWHGDGRRHGDGRWHGGGRRHGGGGGSGGGALDGRGVLLRLRLLLVVRRPPFHQRSVELRLVHACILARRATLGARRHRAGRPPLRTPRALLSILGQRATLRLLQGAPLLPVVSRPLPAGSHRLARLRVPARERLGHHGGVGPWEDLRRRRRRLEDALHERGRHHRPQAGVRLHRIHVDAEMGDERSERLSELRGRRLGDEHLRRARGLVAELQREVDPEVGRLEARPAVRDVRRLDAMQQLHGRMVAEIAARVLDGDRHARVEGEEVRDDLQHAREQRVALPRGLRDRQSHRQTELGGTLLRQPVRAVGGEAVGGAVDGGVEVVGRAQGLVVHRHDVLAVRRAVARVVVDRDRLPARALGHAGDDGGAGAELQHQRRGRCDGGGARGGGALPNQRGVVRTARVRLGGIVALDDLWQAVGGESGGSGGGGRHGGGVGRRGGFGGDGSGGGVGLNRWVEGRGGEQLHDRRPLHRALLDRLERADARVLVGARGVAQRELLLREPVEAHRLLRHEVDVAGVEQEAALGADGLRVAEPEELERHARRARAEPHARHHLALAVAVPADAARARVKVVVRLADEREERAEQRREGGAQLAGDGVVEAVDDGALLVGVDGRLVEVAQQVVVPVVLVEDAAVARVPRLLVDGHRALLRQQLGLALRVLGQRADAALHHQHGRLGRRLALGKQVPQVDQHAQHALRLQLLLDLAQALHRHALLRLLPDALHVDLVHRHVAPGDRPRLVRVRGRRLCRRLGQRLCQRLRQLGEDLGVALALRIAPAAQRLAPQATQRRAEGGADHVEAEVGDRPALGLTHGAARVPLPRQLLRRRRQQRDHLLRRGGRRRAGLHVRAELAHAVVERVLALADRERVGEHRACLDGGRCVPASVVFGARHVDAVGPDHALEPRLSALRLWDSLVLVTPCALARRRPRHLDADGRGRRALRLRRAVDV